MTNINYYVLNSSACLSMIVKFRIMPVEDCKRLHCMEESYMMFEEDAVYPSKCQLGYRLSQQLSSARSWRPERTDEAVDLDTFSLWITTFSRLGMLLVFE